MESIGPAMRERYWHEKDAEQKIAKLAEAVTYLTAEVKELRAQAADFKVHMHGASGIVLPLNREKQQEYDGYFFRNPLGVEPR